MSDNTKETKPTKYSKVKSLTTEPIKNTLGQYLTNITQNSRRIVYLIQDFPRHTLRSLARLSHPHQRGDLFMNSYSW